MGNNQAGSERLFADNDQPLGADELARLREYHLANGYLVRRLLATLDARDGLIEEMRSAFESIERNDKTVYAYRGSLARNRHGELPEPSGKRWNTPAEIAREFIDERRRHVDGDSGIAVRPVTLFRAGCRFGCPWHQEHSTAQSAQADADQHALEWHSSTNEAARAGTGRNEPAR